VLRWTITNGVCPATQDTLTITSALGVTQANAGADQTICIGSANLNANMANPGQGFWTVVSGSGVVTNSLSNSTQLTGMTVGSTVLVWTLTNAGCISSDTMRINRIGAPLANFTYSQSGSLFSFTDLSQNPVSWYWTFGDGNNSNQQNPQHTYQLSGMYTVTLIVANGCGSDTAVYQINNWGLSSTVIPDLNNRIEVYPNPSTGKTTVNIWGADAEEFVLKVTDILGHTVMVSGKKFSLVEGVKWDLDFSELSAGVYQIELTGSGKSVVRQLLIVR
jgi:PKD repeat protein